MPIASIGSLVTNTLNNSNTLTYNLKKWRKVHDLDILVGEETYQTNVQENKAETRYLPLGITADKALNNMNIGTPPTGAAQPRPTSNITPAGMLSFFSRINYGYDGKYLLTLTGRADGSSKFMKGKRWSYFPSAALAWRLSKEKFMEPISAVVNDAYLNTVHTCACK